MKTKMLWSVAALLMCAPAVADAKSSYPSRLPNSAGLCGTCHFSAGGGGARNSFGLNAAANKTDGAPDWQKLYGLDSDGDGYSNGVELGDPTGAWAPGGDPPVGDRISEPGSSASSPCGNGELDPLMSGEVEECDGAELNGATCADVEGDEAATPTCSSACLVDYSPCVDDNNANNTNGGTNNSNNTSGGTNNTAGSNNTNNTAGETNNSNGSNNANNTSGETNNSNTGGGVTGDGGDDADEGCTQAPMGRVPGAPGVGLLGLLGLFAWRRRRAG